LEILFQKEKLEEEHKHKMKSQGEYENLQRHIKEQEDHLAHFSSILTELGEVDYDPQQHLQLKSKLELIEKNKEKVREVNQKIKELPVVEKEIEELTQRVELIKEEIQKIGLELGRLAFDELIFKQKSLELENMRQKVFDLQLSIKDVIYQERLILQEKESIEQQIQQNITLEKEIKSLEQERLYLEKLSLILTDFKLHLIYHVVFANDARGKFRVALDERPRAEHYRLFSRAAHDEELVAQQREIVFNKSLVHKFSFQFRVFSFQFSPQRFSENCELKTENCFNRIFRLCNLQSFAFQGW